MLFKIKKSYKSGLSAQEIFRYIEHFNKKESGFWKLRGKVYDVQSSGYEFVLEKRGPNANGPAHPLIKGRVQEGECVLVNLDIRPSYIGLAFCAVIAFFMLFAGVFSDKMTIDGVVRRPDLAERVLWVILSIGIPATLCYFKDIRPVKAAEQWLTRKLVLKEI